MPWLQDNGVLRRAKSRAQFIWEIKQGCDSYNNSSLRVNLNSAAWRLRDLFKITEEATKQELYQNILGICLHTLTYSISSISSFWQLMTTKTTSIAGDSYTTTNHCSTFGQINSSRPFWTSREQQTRQPCCFRASFLRLCCKWQIL